MKRKLWLGGWAGGLILILVSTTVSGDFSGIGAKLQKGESRSEAMPEGNVLYTRECGSCHFAYQPGLLPAASWKKIMANLSDHFGDNAELAADDLSALSGYLATNAADHSLQKRSVKVIRSLQGQDSPIRITQVPYIRRKHHEIPSRFITDNPKVISLSHCNACHVRADKGSYSEHEVLIPGYGRWDD